MKRTGTAVSIERCSRVVVAKPGPWPAGPRRLQDCIRHLRAIACTKDPPAKSPSHPFPSSVKPPFSLLLFSLPSRLSPSPLSLKKSSARTRRAERLEKERRKEGAKSHFVGSSFLCFRLLCSLRALGWWNGSSAAPFVPPRSSSFPSCLVAFW